MSFFVSLLCLLQRTTGAVSNGSGKLDDTLASLGTSSAIVLTNHVELGMEMTAHPSTPSVGSSGNQTPISGKDTFNHSNVLLCLATPGRPEDDQKHPPEMTPTHGVGDDQTPGPSTSNEGCEEDLLPTTTTDRTEGEGQSKEDKLKVSNCVYVGGGG